MAGNAGGTAAQLPGTRPWGRMTRGRETGVSDHACWAYRGDADRAATASAWLAEGRRLGQRCLYVADLDREGLLRDLASMPDVPGALDSGALVVFPSSELYDLSGPIDAQAQLCIYAPAVTEALASGYTGLRVAADITPLVADASRRPAHLRWEQYADRYIAENPLAPLCMYDVARVANLDAIACVHPLQGPADPLFSLYALGRTTASLAGEVDASIADTLAEMLRAMPDTDTSIDVSQLSFVDGRSAWTLHQELQRRRQDCQSVTLAHPTKLLRSIWRACGFDALLLAA